MKLNKIFVFFLISTFYLIGCGEASYTPKPKGYYQITLPKKEYTNYKGNCPFSFDIPVYSEIQDYKSDSSKYCWKNLQFGKFKATVHISYYGLNNDLLKHSEDSRSLAYRHSIKAQFIDEKIINNPKDKVYGVVYDIGGNTASSFQFWVTDSSMHFVRGSLYFNFVPNPDSLAPVSDFVKQDIYHMINTFKWQ